jgi:hypothetical protein
LSIHPRHKCRGFLEKKDKNTLIREAILKDAGYNMISAWERDVFVVNS